MTDIEGLTNPFENAITGNKINNNQINQNRVSDYEEAISLGYEPPQDVLDAINELVAMPGDLTQEQQNLLESLLDQILAEISPVITSDGGGDTATVSVAENTTFVTTVAAIDNYSLNGTENLTYSITGGAHAALFTIDQITGELSFITAPDFESGGAGDYEVIVQTNDGDLLIDTQVITVTVTDENDVAPVITSAAAVSVAENTTAVMTVTSTDLDTVGSAIYSILGGDDASLFSIDSNTGEVSFNAAPDFESPGDVGGDNVYNLIVQVDDGVQTDTQAIAVTVADVANPVLTFNDPTPTDMGAAGGGDFFSNNAVAISGNLVLVGAQFDDTNGVDVGQAYLFDATSGALLQTFDDPTPTATGGAFGGDEFGSSVAIDGNNVLIGAQRADVGGLQNTGEAHLFDATTGNLVRTFDNPTPAAAEFFGNAVAIEGNNALIGAMFEDAGGGVSTNFGAAYLFDVTTGGLLHTFLDPTPNINDRFGQSLDMDGNNVLIGAGNVVNGATDVGSAHLFDATTGALVRTFLDPTPGSGFNFGTDVAIDGNNVLVGASLDNADGFFVGQAYLFDATTGDLLHTFSDPTPTPGDRFGSSVEIVDNFVFIGAPLDGTNSPAEGQVLVFDATTGALLETIDDPTPTGSDTFGASLAVEGDNLMIGAPRDDTLDTNVGQAHLFDLGELFA